MSHTSTKLPEDGTLTSTRSSHPEYVEMPDTLRLGESISNPPYDYMQVKPYLYHHCWHQLCSILYC